MNSKCAVYLASMTLMSAGMMSLARAAVVQFTIDSAQTQVTLSGTAAGLNVTEQGPGSLTTSFTGTVLAEVTQDSLRFVGGSHIEGVINGNWSPMAFGEEGTEPADFGARAGSSVLLSGTGSLRDLLLDLESETAAPLTQGEFNADGLLFRFPEDAPSAFDYRVTALFVGTQSDRRLLAGFATNSISTAGTLLTEGSNQIIQIPIAASITFELLNPGDSSLTITGQLQATRVIEDTPGIVIGSIGVEGNTLNFQWTGAGDEPVRIESTTDLSTWVQVEEIPLGVTTWSIAVNDGAAFFRVVQ